MLDYAAVITIGFSLLTPLFGLILYLFKKIDKSLEKTTDKGIELSQKLEVMAVTFTTMKMDIEKALILSQRNENLSNEIDDMKRDIRSCRNEIDEINLKVKGLI